MSSREVVTLQVGHYSNFIGTHWWNLQEASFVYDAKASTAVKELNHDVLFREGRNLMGDVTYTPRLISLDLKGSLNTLRQEGTLYDVRQEEDVNWQGDVTLHSSVTPAKNEFLRDLERDDITEVIESSAGTQVNPDDRDEAEATGGNELTEDHEGQVFGPKFYDLDNDVKVWSDFLRIHLHPRSVNMVQEYTHDNETELFDIFGCGESLFSNYNRRTSVEDQIHFFTEECDNLQGFHVLADVYNGFGGMAAWIAQYLEEEFPNKGSLTFGVHPAFFPNSTSPERIHRLISSLLSYDKMVAHSSLFVPLSLATNVWKTSGPSVSFPYLKYQANLNYHTSAVLAASLDTCTLPYRLETGASRLSDMTHSFHHLGRRVAALSSSLPFPMSPSATFVESLMSQQGRLPWCPVSPGVAGVASPYMQSVVVRGIPKSRVKSLSPGPDIPRVLSRCDTAEDILKLYVTEMFPSTFNAGSVVNAGCKVTSPFPHIFSPRVMQAGWLTDTYRQSKQGVDVVPVMTALQNSPEVGSSLQQLHSEASKVNIRKYHQFLENGMEEDDFRETLEHVATLYQCYES